MKTTKFIFLVLLFAQQLSAQDCSKFVMDGRGIENCGYREDYNGKWVIKPQFACCRKFIDGIANVCWIDKKGYWFVGYINCNGQFTVPPIYKYGEDEPVDGLAIVSLADYDSWKGYQGQGGVIDVKTHKIIVPLEFDVVNRLGKTFMVSSSKSNGPSVYDSQGKVIGVSCKYFHDGYHVVKTQSKIDVYDANLNYLFSVEASSLGPEEKGDHISLFNHLGQTSYTYNGKFGIVDKNGKIIKDANSVNEKYEFVDKDSEGRRLVRNNGKYGFINEVGEPITAIDYDFALPFSDGRAVVKKNGMYGFIDRSGNIAIPLQYTNAVSFYNGQAWVESGDKTYYINVDGAVVLDMQNLSNKKEKRCIQTCGFCGGLGYNERTSEDCCSVCGGKGYTSSKWISNSRGGEWLNTACWKCNGTGGCKQSKSKEYCKYCNHTGCAVYE